MLIFLISFSKYNVSVQFSLLSMSEMALFSKKLPLSNKRVVSFYAVTILFITCALVYLSYTGNRVVTFVEEKQQVVDDDRKWRQNEMNLLSEVVQNRIYNLQNPNNCDKAKKLLCTVDSCGFGCQIHSFVACFLHGYRTNRTVVLMNTQFLYGNTEWETVFEPVSICQNRTLIKTQKKKNEVLEKPYQFDYNRKSQNFKIPDDIVTSLQRFHKNPRAWWVGQFMRYILKLKPNIETNIEKNVKLLGIESPTIGIHIRTTDKVKEAKLHDADEYMSVVNEIFDRYFVEEDVVKTKLYVISDNKQPIQKIKQKYPQHQVISDLNNTNWTTIHTRSTSSSLMSILMDIFLLSKCDYVVCTFSSNVCRFAYELKQITTLDAPERYYTLDMAYHFVGMG